MSDTLSALISIEVMVAAIVVIVLWRPQTLSPEGRRLIAGESESATEQPEPQPMAPTSAGQN